MDHDLDRTLDNLATKRDWLRLCVMLILGVAVVVALGGWKAGMAYAAGIFVCNWFHAEHDADLRNR